MKSYRKNILCSVFLIGSIFAFNAYTTEQPGFLEILNIVKDKAELNNADADTIFLTELLMAHLLTDKDAFNLLTEENDRLQLSEENGAFLLGGLLEKAINLKDGIRDTLGSYKDKISDKAFQKYLDKVDKYYIYKGRYQDFREDLERRIPGWRNKIADIILAINGGLNNINPKWISTILGMIGEISALIASAVGASFGVPILPGLIISLATILIANPYSTTAMLAAAKTFLDVIEKLVRVDPNQPEQSAEEKASRLKEIIEMAKYVLTQFRDNYAVYKPEEVELMKSVVKEVAKGLGVLYSYFFTSNEAEAAQ